jgi:hypothetical protein
MVRPALEKEFGHLQHCVGRLRERLDTTDQSVVDEYTLRVRQLTALEILDMLGVLWTEDHIEVRRHFGLEVTADLLSGSLSDLGEPNPT